jgi:ATP-binding cassette subfamily B protein
MKANKRFSFWSFAIFYIKKYKISFSLSLFTTVGYVMDNAILPYIPKFFIDGLSEYSQDTSYGVFYYIKFAVIFSISAWLFDIIAWRIGGYGLVMFRSKLDGNVKKYFFEKVIEKPNKFFTNNESGKIMAKIQNISHAFSYVMFDMINFIIPTVINIVVVVYTVCMINVSIGLTILLYAIIHIGLNIMTMKYFVKLNEEYAEAKNNVLSTISDCVNNHKLIKSFGKTLYETRMISRLSIMEIKKNIRCGKNFNHLILILSVICMLICGAWITYQEVSLYIIGKISLGDISFIFLSVFNLFTMLFYISFALVDIFRNIGISIDSFSILNDTQENINNLPNIDIKNGYIEYKSVNFGYHANEVILRDFNLQIPSGQKLGIIGASGSGKSTIINLLLRWNDINSGTIEIDGKDISQYNIKSIHKNIALVSQNVSLFERTIYENIKYGSNTSDMNRVHLAARDAMAHDFIMNLPDGYNTKVSSKSGLSGGQMQRISIARALLKNSKIIVMDEATSSLDPETERYIADIIEKVSTDRTVIVVAHKIATISKMDRIIVIRDGTIVEDGIPSELMINKNSEYYKLILSSGSV